MLSKSSGPARRNVELTLSRQNKVAVADLTCEAHPDDIVIVEHPSPADGAGHRRKTSYSSLRRPFGRVEQPAGVLARQSTDLVQRGQILGVQLDLGGPDIVLQLLDPFGADDHGGDHGLMQQPGDGDLGLWPFVFGGDARERLDKGFSAPPVYRREVELGLPPPGRVAAIGVFSRSDSRPPEGSRP